MSARLVPARVTTRAKSPGRVAFGPRFFVALLLGLVWAGPAWWDLRFLWALAAWNVIVFLAWWSDLGRLPRPEDIQVSRTWTEPLGLASESRVLIEVANHGAVAVQVDLTDDSPGSIAAGLPSLRFEVAAQRSLQQGYLVRPAERGDHAIGPAFLRYRSALKLAERWASAELAQTVRVYPNLKETKRHTLFLIRSRQIELEKRLKRQPERGREFESLRDYREGDEPRDICWTATARRARLITKVYQAERSQPVLIVVDAGRLMLARAGPLTKLDYAVDAALSLAQVALFSGDYVGLLAYGRRIQARLEAARGAAHLRAFLEQLAMVRGELVEAGHALAADTLVARQRRRALVVWLTDLAETAATPEVIEGASKLLPRHLVLFAAIGQPDVAQLVSRRPESLSEMYRYVAAQEVVHRRELLLRRLRERGALAMELNPGQLATALVNQYLQVKERSLL